MNIPSRPIRIENPIKNYAWGSKTLMCGLFQLANDANQPQAEMWMGAHPLGSSSVILTDGHTIPLIEVIAKKPESIFGKKDYSKFKGALPFLLKVLCADSALSIQAHPNLSQAHHGFERENTVPLDAPHRNYKDNNHKPELICALTDFESLNGFRRKDEIWNYLEPVKSDLIQRALDGIRENGLKGFYSILVGEKHSNTSSTVKSYEADCVETIRQVRQYCSNKNTPVFELVMKLIQRYPNDIGVLAPFYLNYVVLKPGEAMYLPAGQLHSYVRGAGIEIMANSDNVLRGGLTHKHVDTSELLKVLKFEETKIDKLIAHGEDGDFKRYRAPVREFELSTIEIQPGNHFQSKQSREVEILFCSSGEVDVSGMALSAGKACLIPVPLKSYAIRGEGKLFKASLPSE